MSVIAWDSKTLAIDRLAVDCDLGSISSKYKLLADGRLLAWVGGHSSGRFLANWYEKGADPAEWPSFQNGGEEGARLIIVHPDGRCQEYANSPAPMVNDVFDKFRAWGSGRDYAMGAMAMGATATEAVTVASRFCITCGGGVDSFEWRKEVMSSEPGVGIKSKAKEVID